MTLIKCLNSFLDILAYVAISKASFVPVASYVLVIASNKTLKINTFTCDTR